MRSNPIFVGISAWIEGLGSADSWDGYWYNNAYASGDQLYPKGLSKYFDIHSTAGLWSYLWYFIWVELQLFFLPFTFGVPVEIWIAWFTGANTDQFWKILLFYLPFTIVSGGLPSLVAWFFHIKMEDGWGILAN